MPFFKELRLHWTKIKREILSDSSHLLWNDLQVFFLRTGAYFLGKSFKSVAQTQLEALRQYSWPLNNVETGVLNLHSVKNPPITLALRIHSSSASLDSTNCWWCGTAVFTTEKHPSTSGHVQFRSMLFKNQLYFPFPSFGHRVDKIKWAPKRIHQEKQTTATTYSHDSCQIKM